MNAHFIENLPIEPRFLNDRPKSNTEKVAILLASLEHSLAIDLLKKFEPEDVKQILESSSKLGALKSGDVEPLVEEFSNEFSRALGISAGSDQLMVLLESAFTSEQVARLLGRPALVCHEKTQDQPDPFKSLRRDLGDDVTKAKFTFLGVPVKTIFPQIPNSLLIHSHTDRWMYVDSAERKQAWEWFQNVVGAKPVHKGDGK